MHPISRSAAACSDSAKAGRATVPALCSPLAVALLLTTALLAACGGGDVKGSDQSAPADAKTPQIRCAP
ncbi:MAG: hypothetical protein HHJ16_09375 [Polaromonas sp.]|uniref:hypothetical protein n=1 Tax=Polaromonas sp. TaxID=1869339 RepID=UPI001825563C|nr:hypothetical protein [Polaromonas sp.]NMM10471.1 hypothetical protein [Polaromonas sp.]